MKLDRAFLRSQVGRRMFFVLLAAAAGPLAFFGVLSYRSLSDNAAAQTQLQLSASTKYAALGMLNRLILARTVLGVVMSQGRVDAIDVRDDNRDRVIGNIAVVARDGQRLAGSEALTRLWRSTSPTPRAGEAVPVAGLWWPQTDPEPGHRPPVVVTRVAADGVIWLGEVDGDFLFDPLSADLAGGDVCAFDTQGHAISCPAAALDSARQRLHEGAPGSRGESATWNLFLRSEFSAEDWVFVALANVDHSSGATESVAKSAAKASLATLLIVTLLSLVQVRRITVPLERLIDVTRRLIRRDFSARVPIDRDDEFGELARSFNVMAAQIGRQIDALQVQSTIDGEILNGLVVEQVMQRVVQRLEFLIPGAQAVVIEMSPASRDTATVHRHGAVAPAAHPSNAVLWPVASPDRWRTWHTDECPAELRRLLPSQPATIHALTVSERDEHLALIVIGVPTDAPFDDEVRREASELRDRVAVALAAARREKRLIERATRDSLTGLLNRAGLAEAVGMRIDTPDNGAEAFILFFVDLDKFKDVNDALGHQAGDELLCIVAQRLRDCATMDTLIARPGGDEFVLLVFGAVEDVATLAARICASLAEPIPLRGQVMSIGASVGLARYPDHGSTLDDLLRRADMAMYQAKAAGRGRFQWFEPALDRRAADRMSLLNDLRQAIPQHEFELHYQPRVSATTGQVRSVEALLRWRHPVRGLVLPAIFIDLLEETGMIEGVGHWVLETACTQLVRWRAQGLVLPCVAVNASPRQIDIPGYADRVLDTLDAAGLSPRDIELEVTESLFVDAGASSTGAALRRLREAGVGIAIDDFGTGYSSLSYLHRLPVDVLKIDRSFVEQLGAATDAEGVIHAIVALARTLKKRVVAEGVETAEQARHLRTVGCDEFQGYFYSRPLEPRALASWLAAQSTAAGQHLSADVV